MTNSFLSDTTSTLNAVKNLALGVLPLIPTERRYGANSITTKELEAALSPHVPEARLHHLEIEFDSKGTTDRARLHLHWNESGVQANLPTTAFVKGTPTTVSSRILNSVFGLCETEVRFYNQIYPDVADITVKPYVARVGAGGRFVIALEDLSNRASFYQTGDQPSLAYVEAMIGALAKLHAKYWQSPRFKRDLSWVTPYAQRPGHTLSHLVENRSEEWLIERGDAPKTVLRLTRFFLENRRAVDRVWESLPPTLCHGDPHLANTYTLTNGQVGLLDWQNMHKMNGLRDVAYFLGYSLTTEQRHTAESNLIKRYLEQLAAHGVKEVPTYSQAFDLYRLLMLDTWTSVWMTLAIGGMSDEDLGELAIKRIYETLEDLDTEKALRSAVQSL